MAITSSPWKSATDSPSRQLLWELGHLGIASQESFYARLDRQNYERELVHKKALAAAAAEHNRIRESAELVRRELELQVQNERRRRDEEQRRELEQKRQEQVEWEIEEKKLLEREKARTAELEAKRVEQDERLRRAEADAAAQVQKAEKDRQESEAAARVKKEKQNEEIKKRLAEAKAAQQKPTPTPTPIAQSLPAATIPKPQPTTTAVSSVASGGPATKPERETEHQRYLAIHQQLKELRKAMTAEGAKSPELKKNMGEMRREIRKSVGQLRIGQGVNKVPLQNIINALRSSLKISCPQIPVSPFLSTPPALPADAPTTGPSLLLYLLNIFSKAIVAQLISEAGIETAKADPIGTIASHIFALGDFQWNGYTLIDILIAKYHVACPVLFGIYGPENTNVGKARLGWAREGGSRGPFVGLQQHSQRMAGLGAGFAGISLRNYEKAKHKNPYPATKYWTAFSDIVNVPVDQRTETHAMVLKAMIEGYEERFLLFYGNAAMCALRMAIREFPRRVEAPGMSMRALGLLGDVVLKERKIRI